MRKLLCVMLDVRAHVEANGAQLDRLDARVSTLEQRATTPCAAVAVARFQPAAAARGRALTLLDLSGDSLDKVATFLDPDDELAASLACRTLRDAIRARPSAVPQRRTLKARW
jgi:hypothetical protein